jgi:hypothetical protein
MGRRGGRTLPWARKACTYMDGRILIPLHPSCNISCASPPALSARHVLTSLLVTAGKGHDVLTRRTRSAPPPGSASQNAGCLWELALYPAQTNSIVMAYQGLVAVVTGGSVSGDLLHLC